MGATGSRPDDIAHFVRVFDALREQAVFGSAAHQVVDVAQPDTEFLRDRLAAIAGEAGDVASGSAQQFGGVPDASVRIGLERD